MTDIRRRVEEVKSIVDNDANPKWRRVTQALGALAGLELSQVPLDLRKSLETTFVAINRILGTYQLKSFDDYEQMTDSDAEQILAILNGLIFRVTKGN